jgi:chromosome segregation ATPase
VSDEIMQPREMLSHENEVEYLEDRIRELEAECERLREHLSKCNDAGRKFHTQRDEARAEVERLRDSIAESAKLINKREVALHRCDADRDEAVRLLRELVEVAGEGGYKFSDGDDALAAAEKYLEGKAGAS